MRLLLDETIDLTGRRLEARLEALGLTPGEKEEYKRLRKLELDMLRKQRMRAKLRATEGDETDQLHALLQQHHLEWLQ
jgi:hypothetical protein